MTNDRDKEKSPFAGALADQLKDLDVDPAERSDSDRVEKDRTEEAPAEKQTPTNKAAPSDEPELPEESNLSDDEMFARALEDMGPEDVFRGKYEGEGPQFASADDEPTQDGDDVDGAPGDEADEADEERAREQISQARDLRQFEKAVGPVEPMENRDKYRRASPADPTEDARRRTSGGEELQELVTPTLAKSGEGLHNVRPLDAAQKELLARFEKRAKHRDIPDINVRGHKVDEALAELEFFVHQQHADEAHFVHVIHGRGLRSNGPPVLKPAVLRWLEGPGLRYVRGYAPKVNSAGDFGSLVVELVRG